MNKPHDAIRWREKADNDFTAANELRGVRSQALDVICFHCQQAAEKYLKAVAIRLGLEPPKTHNLNRLAEILQAFFPMEEAMERDITWLSEFAVEARYPSRAGLAITEEHAEMAITIAKQVKEACRPIIDSVSYQP